MLTFVVCGCGSRSRTYTKIACSMPERYQCVAGADPINERVEAIKGISNNSDFQSFESAEELLKQPKLADFLIIGTQDHYHFEPAKKALELGYHLLLEKPAAQTIEEIEELQRLAKRYDRKVILCFVLRYTPFYKKVKEIVQNGSLGEIISLQATEGVEPFHQAHSFVRGHWSQTHKSTPMIVSKCSHDMDLIAWLLEDNCEKVESFGSLSHFHKGNMPEGATPRCTGCPHQGNCSYDAHLYLTKQERWLDMVYPDPGDRTEEAVLKWLESSPWGRCVYQCDNDVVDHQIVNMQFNKGATAALTMTAFDLGRELQIFGTKASLHGGHLMKEYFDCDLIIRHHHSNEVEKIKIDPLSSEDYVGHGGGDYGLINSLDRMICDPNNKEGDINHTLEGHRIAFQAEQSRLKNTVISD